MGITNTQGKNFRGTGVALITPFRPDGEIDYPGLKKILDYTREGGVDYYVILGTTGEPATLDKEEKIKILEFVAEYNQGRIPLIAGMGGNNTREISHNLKEYPLEGYSAVLSVSPYYNKPSQEGIYQHYKALSQASPLPIMLYNVPGRTGTNVLAETTLRIASDCPNVFGIKEASGNFDQFSEILRHKAENFELISGDDGLAVPMIALGATGLISVIANSHPYPCSEMVRKALEGNFLEARKDHLKLSAWMSVLFKESNPTGVKAILQVNGICGDMVRLPLVPGSESLRKEIHSLQMEKAG